MKTSGLTLVSFVIVHCTTHRNGRIGAMRVFDVVID